MGKNIFQKLNSKKIQNVYNFFFPYSNKEKKKKLKETLHFLIYCFKGIKLIFEMFIPGFSKDKFITELPKVLSLSLEEKDEVRLKLRDLWIDFDNMTYEQETKPRSKTNREHMKFINAYKIVSDILGIDPTNIVSVTTFFISFDDERVIKFLIGLHNAKVYECRFMAKEKKCRRTPNDCYINRQDLARIATPLIPETEHKNQIIRLFSRSCMHIGFALNGEYYVEAIRSLPTYPNGRNIVETNETHTVHKDPATAIKRYQNQINQYAQYAQFAQYAQNVPDVPNFPEFADFADGAFEIDGDFQMSGIETNFDFSLLPANQNTQNTQNTQNVQVEQVAQEVEYDQFANVLQENHNGFITLQEPDQGQSGHDEGSFPFFNTSFESNGEGDLWL